MRWARPFIAPMPMAPMDCWSTRRHLKGGGFQRRGVTSQSIPDPVVAAARTRPAKTHTTLITLNKMAGPLKNSKHEQFAQLIVSGETVERAAHLADIKLLTTKRLRHSYVYILVDPSNGAPFYVGKGKNRRYAAHEREAVKVGGNNIRKLVIIRRILADGMRPKILILEDGLTSDQALYLEGALIAALGQVLTNSKHPVSPNYRIWCTIKENVDHYYQHRATFLAASKSDPYEIQIRRICAMFLRYYRQMKPEFENEQAA